MKQATAGPRAQYPEASASKEPVLLTSYRAKLLQLLLSTTTAVKVGFCFDLPRNLANSIDDGHKSALPSVLGSLWSGFRLEEEKASSTLPSYPGQRIRAPRPAVTAKNVLDIIQVSEGYLEEIGISRQDVYNKVEQACVARSTVHIDSVPMQLVTLLCSKGPTLGGLEARRLCSTIIQVFVATYVGKEPLPPTTWTRTSSQSSCSCADCARVSAFLASPAEQVGSFALNQSRRKHLSSMFGYRRNSSFVIKTLTHTRPQTMEITKDLSEFEAQHRTWMDKATAAKTLLSKLDGADQRLKDVLGDTYAGVMSLDPACIADLQQAREHQPLRERNANNKRPLPHDSGIASKRPAVQPYAGAPAGRAWP